MSAITLRRCSNPLAHVSSVYRPGGVKADRCFFCPETVEAVEYVSLDEVLDLLREGPPDEPVHDAAKFVESYYRKSI
jgi:hypothetical protein